MRRNSPRCSRRSPPADRHPGCGSGRHLRPRSPCIASRHARTSTSYDFDIWGNRWHLARSFSTADQNVTETLTHGYDTLDRLTSVSASRSPWLTPDESYGYDLFGNRTTRSRSTASGTSSWSYAHDAAHRLTSFTQSGASASQALLRYDDNGNLTALCEGGPGGSVSSTTNPALANCTASGPSSQTRRMSWNGLDQLLKVSQTYAGTALPSEAYSYDAGGRRIAKARSGNVGLNAAAGTLTTHYLYGGSDILAEWTALSSSPVFSGTPKAVYTHAGTDSPVLRIADSLEGGGGSSGLPTGSSQVYAQDGLGSVVAMLDAPARVNLAQLPQNVLTSTDASDTGYLNDGDTSNVYGKVWSASPSGGSHAMLALAQSTMVDAVEVVAPVGGLGRPTTVAVEIRDADGNWSMVVSQAANYDASNTARIGLSSVRAWAVRVSFQGVTTPNNGTASVGELRILSASNLPANYAATQSFDAWGNVVQRLDGVPTYGYTGREPDGTGLVYYRARYYQPELGRFISRDPLGLAAGINPYSYVNNNPANLVDPSGLLASRAFGVVQDYAGRATSAANEWLSQLDVGGAADQFGRKLASEFVENNKGTFGAYGWAADKLSTYASGYNGNSSNGQLAGGLTLASGMMLPGGALGKVRQAEGLVAGQGGRFASLIGHVGDDLTAHHIPQAALGFTSRADGGAVVMTTADHFATRTYGFKGVASAIEDAGLSFRDVLAKDIRDVRSIVGNAYNQGLQDVLKYYRENFPELMKKEAKP